MSMAKLIAKLHQEPMHTWDRVTWQDEVFDQLVVLTHKCKRMDAVALPEFGKDLSENAAPNPTKPVNDELKQRLRDILKLVRFHAALAPIRCLLEAAMDKQESVESSSETLQEIR